MFYTVPRGRTLKLPVFSIFSFFGIYLHILCCDRPAPLFLFFGSVLLRHSPRLKLAAAEYRVDDGTAEVNPSCDPEHLPPALQSVLTSREEEYDSVQPHKTGNLNLPVNYKIYLCIYYNRPLYAIILYIVYSISGILQIKIYKVVYFDALYLLHYITAITYFIGIFLIVTVIDYVHCFSIIFLH